MDNDEEAQSTGWSSSFFKQTTSFHTPQPSIVSTKEGSGSQLERLQNHVARIIKGISSPPEMRIRPYNPELLTCQKRQWAKFQLQSLDHKVWKDPSKLFESMVIVGIPPTADTQALQNLYTSKMFGGSSRFQSVFSDRYQSLENPNLEPQVLFVYPPEKQLPLKYKDLLLFCFPSGVEVNAVERTQSMSELNEIFLGQEHHKPSESSFVFRLQVADDSTLYGCCVLVEEIIQKPSTLISMILHGQPLFSNLGRHIFTTHRCYCILSRLPFFDLHFGVLNSILTEERFERLTKQINYLDLESPRHSSMEDGSNTQNRTTEASQSSTLCSLSETQPNYISHFEQKSLEGNDYSKKDAGSNYHVPQAPETDMGASYSGETAAKSSVDHNLTSKELSDKCVPKAVLPFIQFQQGESFESSSSFQCSPSQDQLFRNNVDETAKDDELSAGQDIVSDHSDILDWAKANNHGSLQLICEYYRLHCLSHGSTIRFQPLDHLNPLEYSRPNETVLRIAGSRVDLRSYNSSLELAEAHNELMAEEEAAALSVWVVSCLCGTLRLEHVLTLFSGALLEKQIVVVCSNLGILSALVLSIIPLIRPYHWQSLLMPILPHDMLDFLDAPVPYVVGVQNRTDEMQSKLANVILVDANRNQVKSPAIPQLPGHRELYSRLNAYHAKLVGESYLAKRRRVYECTDVQVEAAKGFLRLLHAYLDSLCSNLRSHTITNVQSNDDKVSLLLKESFIGSFPRRDQPFMKLFVDTQLFSVHTDLVLSVYQKE